MFIPWRNVSPVGKRHQELQYASDLQVQRGRTRWPSEMHSKIIVSCTVAKWHVKSWHQWDHLVYTTPWYIFLALSCSGGLCSFWEKCIFLSVTWQACDQQLIFLPIFKKKKKQKTGLLVICFPFSVLVLPQHGSVPECISTSDFTLFVNEWLKTFVILDFYLHYQFARFLFILSQ